MFTSQESLIEPTRITLDPALWLEWEMNGSLKYPHAFSIKTTIPCSAISEYVMVTGKLTFTGGSKSASRRCGRLVVMAEQGKRVWRATRSIVLTALYRNDPSLAVRKTKSHQGRNGKSDRKVEVERSKRKSIEYYIRGNVNVRATSLEDL
jgi:hypothetical protein